MIKSDRIFILFLIISTKLGFSSILPVADLIYRNNGVYELEEPDFVVKQNTNKFNIVVKALVVSTLFSASLFLLESPLLALSSRFDVNSSNYELDANKCGSDDGNDDSPWGKPYDGPTDDDPPRLLDKAYNPCRLN